MPSRTKLKLRVKRKTNSYLVETIRAGMDNKAWEKVTNILAGPTRKYVSANLFEIDAGTTVGDTVVIPGKVLSKGELKKKIVICALSASEKAMEKIKASKSEFVPLVNEIKKNPKAEGIKLLA
jgi:large subunit ribosomal protein L18e